MPGLRTPRSTAAALSASAATLGALCLCSLAASAAGESGRMLWGGSVDGEAEVMIRRESVKTHVVAGKGIDRPRKYFFQRMPDKPIRVTLSRVQGRGRVEVFQQPGLGNDYTAGVRITDPPDGRSEYQFVVNWEPRPTR